MGFFKTTVKDWLEKIISTTKITEEDLDIIAKQSAIKDVAMYTAVGLIADLLAGCEILVFEKEKPVKNTNWYRFNVQANPNHSANDAVMQWIVNYFYKTDGALMVPLSGNIYTASSFAIEERPIAGHHFRGICIDSYQINKEFDIKDVYYICQPKGKNIRLMINRAFDVYAGLLENSKKSYSQNSGEKYVLQLGTYPSGNPEEQKQYLDSVSENLTNFLESSSAALPITKDQQLTRLSAAGNGSSAGDYVSLRKDIYNIVSSVLHLPAGLLDGTSTASDQILNQALTMAIDPLAEKISEELTRKTYSATQVIHGNHIKVDTSKIKHVDIVDNADKLDKLVASGIMCIDEVRKLCELPEINEDWAEAHYITKNYGEVTSTLNPLDPLEGGEK